ncbi:MAG: hypothetical protein ACXAEB_12625 [Candidatus Thorarchaeota archaeon]|jgi:hypothetical protein
MTKFPLRYYCYVCGHLNNLNPEVPEAPKMTQHDVKCENCGDGTHIIVTACPHCKEIFRYFLSDLDYTEEIQRLAGTYVKLIDGIRSSIKNHVKEFKVPLPKRWAVGLACGCGEEYTAEIPLPQKAKK